MPFVVTSGERRPQWSTRLALRFSALILACAGSLAAQDLRLPTNPRAWMNSPAVSLETLKGKGVVFYFFEET